MPARHKQKKGIWNWKDRQLVLESSRHCRYWSGLRPCAEEGGPRQFYLMGWVKLSPLKPAQLAGSRNLFYFNLRQGDYRIPLWVSFEMRTLRSRDQPWDQISLFNCTASYSQWFRNCPSLCQGKSGREFLWAILKRHNFYLPFKADILKDLYILNDLSLCSTAFSWRSWILHCLFL